MLESWSLGLSKLGRMLRPSEGCTWAKVGVACIGARAASYGRLDTIMKCLWAKSDGLEGPKWWVNMG